LKSKKIKPKEVPPMNSRPRPVLIYGALVAGLQALLSFAGLTDLLPERAIMILNLVLVVLLAIGGALFVQTQVTPLSDPQASDGRKLVPSPPATVAPGTPPARLDATEDDPGPTLPGSGPGIRSLHESNPTTPLRDEDRPWRGFSH
jgi:hypothetical protein